MECPLGFIEHIKFIGTCDDDPPENAVTHLGVPVTHEGETVTHGAE